MTSGTATAIRVPDGTRVLPLENLDTSDGPDLWVWRSVRPVPPDGACSTAASTWI
ncbi:MAG: hypothetical protein IRY90_17645, partial [Actinomadura rubrobrunea]|nr:hypothetical protein [Actinomadura rubrobrunea]